MRDNPSLIEQPSPAHQASGIRLYNVVAINERSRRKVICTSKPLSHDEACVILGKLTRHPAARLMLEQA